MSQGISTLLAEFYGTLDPTKTASAPTEEDDLLKQAQVELFIKVAADQNVNLAAMTDEAVERLYNHFVDNTKTASAPATTTKTAEDDEEKKKKEEAEKELAEKKAAAEEWAKYDFCGRQMAHAYVDEMKKIAAAAAAAEKTAEFPPKKEGDEGKGKAPPFFAKKKEEHGDEEHEKEHGKEEHEKEKKGSALPVALRKGLDTVRGHAKTASSKLAQKTSAIDDLALERAVVKAAEAGLDAEEAAARLNAAYTLNLFPESTKIAAAGDVATAVEIRALEMLEAARYQVTWGDGAAA